MSLPRLVLVLLLAVCCLAPSWPPPEPPEPGAGQVWVDGGRGESGDGTRERPFRTLAEALAVRPVPTVYVAPGLYEGPLRLPAGARLVGAGPSTVLWGQGREPVVRLEAGAQLSRLALQGGSWGVEGAGRVRLEEVAFSGQREGAVRLSAGSLEAQAVRFEASLSEAVGLWLEGPVAARVRHSTFSGPWRRGVRASGGAQAQLEEVHFQGAVTALEQEGGWVRLWRVRVEGGRGPGLLVRGGTLRVEEAWVTGHEYGLASHGARLEVRGFTSVRAERAGLGLTRSIGWLEELHVRESGSYGAVQLVDSDLMLRGFRVHGADGYGVVATRGRLRASRGSVTGLRSSEGFSGDGLHLRGVEADIESVEVWQAAGAGVLAAQGAQVALRDVTLRGCRQAGLVVESLARVEAAGLEVYDTGGAALVALRDGQARVDALTASGLAEGLVWAECEGETKVRLGRVRAEAPRGQAPPCVEKSTLQAR